MEATKYLIKVDGNIHGYNRLDLLKIDLTLNKPANYELFRNESIFSLRYVPMTQTEITELLKGAHDESN